MKKHPILVSLMASLFLLPGVVRAQSSVTLYGILDTGLQYLSGMPQKHLVSMESGDLVPSRWGVKGTEELGGGTSVIFQLESGFSSTNGVLACGIFLPRGRDRCHKPSMGDIQGRPHRWV
jgi:Outer membrane protein (porin)